VILFLDTSALVKLYVEEAHSSAVREWVDEAEVVAACRVAYPEAVSALNRRMRAGDLSRSAYGLASRALRRDWDRLKSLLAAGKVSGPQVHDARVAAVCRQHGVRELWTADRDFGRFPGLKIRNPLVA
jgi:predicted nucleic acid-binding protein